MKEVEESCEKRKDDDYDVIGVKMSGEKRMNGDDKSKKKSSEQEFGNKTPQQR